MDREEIAAKLVRLIADFTPVPAANIDLDAEMYRDLKVDGDEFSFYFAPLVEREFGLKIPNKDWSRIRTLRELSLYLETRGAGEGAAALTGTDPARA